MDTIETLKFDTMVRLIPVDAYGNWIDDKIITSFVWHNQLVSVVHDMAADAELLPIVRNLYNTNKYTHVIAVARIYLSGEIDMYTPEFIEDVLYEKDGNYWEDVAQYYYKQIS